MLANDQREFPGLVVFGEAVGVPLMKSQEIWHKEEEALETPRLL